MSHHSVILWLSIVLPLIGIIYVLLSLRARYCDRHRQAFNIRFGRFIYVSALTSLDHFESLIFFKKLKDRKALVCRIFAWKFYLIITNS